MFSLTLPAFAQADTNVPPAEKSLHWSDTNLSVRVFLVQRKSVPVNFSLFVTGGDDLTVVYRSEHNSSMPIVRELKPKTNSSIKDLRQYDFRHGFSKSTIWMAIVFKKDDRRIENLTRTFYGSMDKIVPNDEFLKKDGQSHPQQSD